MATGTKITAENYTDLNAKLNLWQYDEKGNKYIDFDADKQAARQYFLTEVNPKTNFFYSLKEKLEFLFVNEYYEVDVWSQYGLSYNEETGKISDDSGLQTIKDLYKVVYAEKPRFESFLGAYKFYQQYALKSFDKKAWLERFEDRVVANALLLGRGNAEDAKRIALEIVSGRLQPATPTFSNAGKKQRGELVSCFLVRTEDSMESISRTLNAALQLSKRGGGVALNLTNLRESGAPIKKIENQSSGIIPVMKMLEDSFSYANQLGTRSGAGAVYLSVHHPDVFKFLDSKRENADEKNRIKTLSLGLVVTDKIFELAKENKDFCMFSPYDIFNEYGKGMADISITEMYDELVDNPRIKKTRSNARNLLLTIAEVQFESGYPYIMFEDTVNRANYIEGRVNMSNLCVTGDTQVLTDSGYISASKLYESQNDFKVVVDTRARDFTTTSITEYGTSVEDSTKMFKTAEDAEVYTIKTAEGFEITATEWHKFYVYRGDEIVKIPLIDIEVGDKILVQSSEGSYGNTYDPHLAYLAGALASDGTFGSNRDGSEVAKWYLYGAKEEFRDALEESASIVLKDQSDLLHKHNATLKPTFSYSTNLDRWSMSSGPLTKLLSSKGVTKSSKLKVPSFVLNGTKDTQVSYLRGVFQLDGSITGSIGNKFCSIELGSVSKEYLQEIQMMILNMGVYSRIYTSRGKRTFIDHNYGREYESKPLYSLRISESSSRIILFNEIGDWLSSHKNRWNDLEGGRETRTKARFHKFTATVVDVEFAGIEDVYDVTVDNGNSLIFNGIATGNCTEILQTNTPSTYNENLSYAQIGNDISCNLASLNIAKAMEGGDLEATVSTAILGLSAVSDLSDIQSVPSIAQGNEASHAIGLGQMNLHGFFIKEGIDYGSEDSIDFTNIYFMTIAYYAYKASMEIAKDRGITFKGFENSQYANADTLTNKYADSALVTPNESTKALFEKYGIYIPTSKDWASLAQDIARHGLYNAYLQAIPPTGSISYINYSTSSIHPVVDRVETRKEGLTGRVSYPQPFVTNENFNSIQDAYQIGPDAIIDVYAAATKHVDQGLSLTLFYTDEATTRTLNKSYINAWRSGIKTLYYARIRQSNLAGTELEDCVSCSL